MGWAVVKGIGVRAVRRIRAWVLWMRGFMRRTGRAEMGRRACLWRAGPG